MKHVDQIVKNMSRSVRSRAEAYARSKGLTLEQAVSQQLDNQLEESDLRSALGGATEFNIECESGRELNIETDSNSVTHAPCPDTLQPVNGHVSPVSTIGTGLNLTAN